MKTCLAITALGFIASILAIAADPLEELNSDSVKALRSTPPRVVRAEPVVRPAATPGARGAGPFPGGTVAPRSSTPDAPPSAYAPPPRADGRHVVALDIGHTRAEPGCFSATGVGEFVFNKHIVERVYQRLADSRIIAPFIVNPEGAAISLPMRTTLAARHGAALFLAIHHDSVQDKYLLAQTVNGKQQMYCDDFHGYGVFVSEKNPQPLASFRFAQLLGGKMAQAGFEFSPHHNEPVPGENRPIIDKYNGVYRYNDLIVLKTALMPAALLECGVIVNREQELLLAQPATQEKIVAAIVAALQEFFSSSPQQP